MHSESHSDRLRVGISGTGFLGRGIFRALTHSPDFRVSNVLTRREAREVDYVDPSSVTRSPQELAEKSDVVLECSGDVFRAAEVVQAAHEAGLPVVTMCSEFHVTVGSWFTGTGFITEAEGDQPGSLAALREDVVAMGFEPVVYGNIKGFLNHHPTLEDMTYWAEKGGISLQQVTSFTDGTKLQVEQALVANGLGAGILQRGLVGTADRPLDESAAELAEQAVRQGEPVADYVLNRSLPPGVFITSRHPFEEPGVLRYLKLGEGPFYTLVRPFHLCHLEVLKTLRRVRNRQGVLLNNSASPRVNVCAVAKRDLKPGDEVTCAMGGFDLRGEAGLFAEEPDAVPLGLLTGARFSRKVDVGHTVRWDDVEIPESLALNAALGIRNGQPKQQQGVEVLPVTLHSQGSS